MHQYPILFWLALIFFMIVPLIAQTLDETLKDQNEQVKSKEPAKPNEGQFPELTAPHLVIHSVAGTELTTPKSTHLHSGEHLALTAGQHLSLSVGKRLLASAMQGIRLFAQSTGIKMFAAKGKVEIQAQSDNLEIIADQVLKIISAKKSIEIAAAEEILLTAKGSYIKINGAGIEHGTPAAFTVHSVAKSFTGPKSLPVTLPRMGLKNYIELNLHWPDLEPAVNAPYYVVFANGAEKVGKLDEKGYARIDNPPDQEYEVWFGEDSRKIDFSAAPESNQPHEVEKIDDALRSEIESFLMSAEQFDTNKGGN